MDFEIGIGKPCRDAVIDAAASWVRPVARGALTTMLGVIPLFGDAFFWSMAVVLVFGLGFATLLTLAVPALCDINLRNVFTELPKAQSFTDVEVLLPTRLEPAALDRDSLQGSFPAARQSVLPHRTLVTRSTSRLSLKICRISLRARSSSS